MKVYIETYGCTANKSDESIIKGLLLKRKHDIVDSIDNADAAVILTCTVIGSTEQRMLHRIRELQKHPVKLVVSGCMASVQPELIKSTVPDAILLKPQYIHHISDVLEDKKTRFTTRDKTGLPRKFDNIIAPIAISEGCLFSCSYCITSPARGKLRSFPIEGIVRDVCQAVKNGCREIQLTAQDTASYGLDINSDLVELLNRVCEIKDFFKIRVGMMNPQSLLNKLNNIIEAYSNLKIYKFLHLPVQSGSNYILEKMNRGYTREDFLKIVSAFRDRYPDITISTDVIVGFPGEDEEAFNQTIDLIKIAKPDIVNITRFSARPFTRAKLMKERVPTEVAKERSRKLTKLCKTISKKINQRYIGRRYSVVITEYDEKHGTFVGRNDNYKPVVLKDKNISTGDIVIAEIIDAFPTYLLGKVI
jgi:MiaB-like tRNA modifying enzyme